MLGGGKWTFGQRPNSGRLARIFYYLKPADKSDRICRLAVPLTETWVGITNIRHHNFGMATEKPIANLSPASNLSFNELASVLAVWASAWIESHCDGRYVGKRHVFFPLIRSHAWTPHDSDKHKQRIENRHSRFEQEEAAWTIN